MFLLPSAALAASLAFDPAGHIVAETGTARITFRAEDGVAVAHEESTTQAEEGRRPGPIPVREGCTVESTGYRATAVDPAGRWFAAAWSSDVLLVDLRRCFPIAAVDESEGHGVDALLFRKDRLYGLVRGALVAWTLPDLAPVPLFGGVEDVTDRPGGPGLVANGLAYDPGRGRVTTLEPKPDHDPLSLGKLPSPVAVEVPGGFAVVANGRRYGVVVPTRAEYAAVTPDARVLVTMHDRTLAAWRVADASKIWEVKDHNPPRTRALRVGTRWVAALGEPILFFDPLDGAVRGTITGVEARIAKWKGSIGEIDSKFAGSSWDAPRVEAGEPWTDPWALLLDAKQGLSRVACAAPEGWLATFDAVPGLGPPWRERMAAECAQLASPLFAESATPADPVDGYATPSWVWTAPSSLRSFEVTDDGLAVRTDGREGLLRADGSLAWSRPFATNPGREREPFGRAMGWFCEAGACVQSLDERPTNTLRKLERRGRDWVELDRQGNAVASFGPAARAVAGRSIVALIDNRTVRAFASPLLDGRPGKSPEQRDWPVISSGPAVPRLSGASASGPSADLVLVGLGAAVGLDRAAGAVRWTAVASAWRFDPWSAAWGAWALRSTGWEDASTTAVVKFQVRGTSSSVTTFAAHEAGVRPLELPSATLPFGCYLLSGGENGATGWSSTSAEPAWTRADLAGHRLGDLNGWPLFRGAVWTVVDPTTGQTVATGEADLALLSAPGGPLRAVVRRADRRYEARTADGSPVGTFDAAPSAVAGTPGGAVVVFPPRSGMPDTQRGAIVAYDETGERWRRVGAVDPHLAVVGDLVLVGSASPVLIALDAATGEVRWATVGPRRLDGALSFPPVTP